jgi:glycosyltransferase involved in cell wall biosynthesis
MSTTPKIRKSRVGIVDGTEMGVLEIHENLPPGSRCVGTIAMVTRDWVAAPTTISWMMDDRSYLGPGEHSQRYIIQGNVLVHQRNECINKMDGDWILFIDSDMVFQPGAVKTLVETQKKFDLDIVGGLCFQRTPPYQPTMYVMAANAQHGYTFLEEWADDAAVEVDATGMAFVLIHKRVFDKILRHNSGTSFGTLEERRNTTPVPFFRWEGFYGEDFLLCREAKEAGCRIFVDTSVKIGHSGQTIITEQDFLREIAFRRPDEQAFREKQLAEVGHKAISREKAKERLGVTW